MAKNQIDQKASEDWQWFVHAFLAPDRRERWLTIFNSQRLKGLSPFDLFDDEKIVKGHGLDWSGSIQELLLETFGATDQGTEVLVVCLGHDKGGMRYQAAAPALSGMLEGVLIDQQRDVAIAVNHNGEIRLFRTQTGFLQRRVGT